MTDSAIARVLGDGFGRLPIELRTVHGGESLVLIGRADIEAGPGILGALIRALFGFPRQGREVPVTISFATDASARDRWRRDFDGRKYESRLEAGSGCHAGLLLERWPPFTWILRPDIAPDGRLAFELAGGMFLGIAIPRPLAPRGIAVESGQTGRFLFDITVDLPIVGRLIHYRGAMNLPADGDRT